MSAAGTKLDRARRVLRLLLASFMVAIGIAHLVSPSGFASIVPRFMPAPVLLVLVSGFFEIAGGVGLLVTRTRRLASFGLVALYIAVFPANLNMALTGAAPAGVHVSPVLLWLRLPLQVVFIAWALWVGRPAAAPDQALKRGR